MEMSLVQCKENTLAFATGIHPMYLNKRSFFVSMKWKSS